jgi:RNA polymerase sigma-70 factor (ECF subfamily)
MNETDEAIYSRFLKERREEDFRILLERHQDSLLLFLRGYARSMEDAEDVLLDAFSEVAAGPTAFSGRSSFRTWLFSIGKKLALKRLRNMRPYLSADEDAEDKVSDPPELELLRDERNRALYRALRQLAPEYRQVLILLYFEDMSHEEAARVMGKSKKQVYHLASRSREALKKELEGMGIHDAQY